VSENKEVRSIRDAAAAAAENGDRSDEPRETAAPGATTRGADAGTDGEATPDASTATGPSEAPDAASNGAPAGSLIEAAEAVGARDAGDDAGQPTDDVGRTADADAGGTADDDAVILGGTDEDEGEAEDETTATDGPDAGRPESGAGETPERPPETAGPDGERPADGAADDGATAGSGAELVDSDADAGGHGAWPAPGTDADDEGYDATPHEDVQTDVDFGGGLAPTDANHAEYVGTADDDGGGDGFVRSERREAAVDGPTEFRCPNCGASRAAADSSLRAGDVCPDCRKGYVAERAVEE
ncbi:MAG: hypothetical protein ABEH47_08650, partial [Haloferacaceae archaeon]